MQDIRIEELKEKMKMTERALSEREKELSLLHETAKLLVTKQQDTFDVLQKLVQIIPTAWQYPEITEARIVYEELEFRTPGFISTRWMQKENFTTVEKEKGFIEIAYLKEKPIAFEGPFLKEERDILGSLAEILKIYIERQKADKDMQENEERHRNLVEYSPEGIYVHMNGKIVYINPAGARLFGAAKPDELIGKSILSLVHPDHVELVKERIRQVEEEGRPEEAKIELKFIRVDGDVIDVKASRTLITYQGKPAVQVATSDITERKRAENALKKALKEVESLKNRLQAENIYLREEIKTEYNFEEIVGEHESIINLLHYIEKVAPADTTVLINGETGTGKELIARAVHNLSARKDRPLVKVNCAAISAGLVESELFGHEKGAFTGAVQQRIGRFELASGGTIFLDEVGELPLDTQVKLLRVLQEGELERVGSSKPIRVDVRVIAATNRNLVDAVREGSFRSDLFYRLSVFPLEVPPLRDRKSDIHLLVNFFISKYSKKLGKKIEGVSKRTIDLFENYTWPGNIRELQNIIERAIVISGGPIIDIEESMLEQNIKIQGYQSDKLEDIERSHIKRVLNQTNWAIEGNKGAAKILGMHPSTLRFRIKKLGISKS
ncbi:MAG: sigma 54-interacting transcriptional regulator [Deltaproteobacteria bacterium]